MWEVFGPVLRWPLYSPLRFVAVVLAVVIAVVLLGDAGDGDPSTSSAAGSAPSAGAPPTAASRPSDTPSLATGDPAPSAASPSAHPSLPVADGLDPTAAADAAAGFVAAWARPDLTAKEWARKVRPLVTDDLWTTGLRVTDPARTPAVTVAGEPREVSSSSKSAVVDVPTTGSWIRVELVARDDGWLVSSVEPIG